MSTSATHHLRTEELPEVHDLSPDHHSPLFAINSGALTILGPPELMAAWLAVATRQVLELLPEPVTVVVP